MLRLHLGRCPLPRSQPGLLRLPDTASSSPRYVDGLVGQCAKGMLRCGGVDPGSSSARPPRGLGPPRTGLRLRCPAFLFLSLFFSFRPFDPGQRQPTTRERDSPTRNQLLAGTAWPQWFLALSTLRPLATARPFGLSCSSVSLLVKTVGTDREPIVSPGDASANSSSYSF